LQPARAFRLEETLGAVAAELTAEDLRQIGQALA